jgi:nucleoside-triphosphatase THEP1
MFLIICGPIGIGKSTLLEKLAKELSEKYSVGGVITKGREKRIFVNVKTWKEEEFSREGEKEGEIVGKFLLSTRALNFAKESIKTSYETDIIFVDEIGKLEGSKKGLYAAVQDLVTHMKEEEKKLVILSVREELESVMDLLFEIDPQKIWKLKKQPDQILLQEIMDVIEINI